MTQKVTLEHGQLCITGINWILVTISALLFSLAFYTPAYADWAVFIFLIPLFVVIARGQPLRFMHGLWWGTIFFAAQWYGLYAVIVQHGYGTWRFILIPFLLLYGAVQSGIWFWCGGRHLGWFAVSTFFYFMWVRYGFFWLFGFFGDTLSSLLLPLAYHARWLYVLGWCGPTVLSAAIVVGSLSVVLSIYHVRWWAVVALFSWLPFIYGWLVPCKILTHAYANITLVAPPTNQHGYILDMVQAINDQLVMALERRPHTQIMIMPESTLPFCLNNHPELIELLSLADYRDDIAVIFGGHRNDTQHTQHHCTRNALFVVKGSSINHYYDKQLLVPFVEYIPGPWQHCTPIKNLFLRNKTEFEPKRELDRALVRCGDLLFYPLICSELYFTADKPTATSHPMICLVNDQWFAASPAFQQRMALYAKYAALAWNCDIIYVGHAHAQIYFSTPVF